MPELTSAQQHNIALALAEADERERGLVTALEEIIHELGVPQPGYPQPVANAHEIAVAALAKWGGR